MGRCRLSYAPRLLTTHPLQQVENAGMGAVANSINQTLPYGIGAGLYDHIAPVVQGMMWGVGAVTIPIAGTTVLDVRNKNNAGGQVSYLKSTVTLPNTDLNAGFVPLGYSWDTGSQYLSDAVSNVHANTGEHGIATRVTPAGGDTVDNVGVALVVSPGGVYLAGGVNVEPAPATHFGGLVLGGLTIIPYPAIDVASSQATFDTFAYRMPFNFRLLGIIASAQASGAGNLVRLYNDTQGLDVVNPSTGIALTSATPASIFIDASQLAVGARDFLRNDRILARFTTGGTGFTRVAIQLVGYVQGHCADRNTRVLHYAAQANIPYRENDVMTRFSGPVAGGLATIVIPYGSLGSAIHTDAVVQRAIVPFDCDVLAVNFMKNTASGVLGGDVQRVYNDTQGSEVAEAALIGTAHSSTVVAGNASLSRGDLISSRASIASAGVLTGAQVHLLVRTKGFPQDDEALD